MKTSWFKFIFLILLVLSLYAYSVYLLKSIPYVLLTASIILIFLFKKIDTVLCYFILKNKDDSKIVVKTKFTKTLSYVSEYNIEGLSYVYIPKDLEFIGCPFILFFPLRIYPWSTLGEFSLMRNLKYKYEEELYIDEKAHPFKEM